MKSSSSSRISSIDFLRGLVMIIMALDHVRDYFHYDAFFYDATDLSQSSEILFFTRWITHFCAPVFVFLAGTSAYFVGKRKGKSALSNWLLKRGIWLVIVELTIIKFAWNFKLDYSVNTLQVIWALGISMIVLAAFIHLPKKWCISICVIGIAIHNAFDGISFSNEFISGIWIFLHKFQALAILDIQFFVAYPLIPWIFLMPLGYHFGALYAPEVSKSQRFKALLKLGILTSLSFILIRSLNVYGDPYNWEAMGNLSFTILSFLNLTKYPPSLLYLMMTIGPSIILLAFSEKWRGKIFDAVVVIGRVPMFYYIIHIYIIHFIALFAAKFQGFEPNGRRRRKR
ncbi:MAG: heparan-alpha-glucosaminide N-acetyltransferase domain-containing protein, partial [Cytophagales bacterium]